MVRKRLLLMVVCLLVPAGAVGRSFGDVAGQFEQAEEAGFEEAEGIYQEIAGENAGTEDGLKGMEELIGLYRS